MTRIPPPPPEKSIAPQPGAGGEGEQLSGVFRLDALNPTGGAEGGPAQLSVPRKKVSTQMIVLAGVLVAGGGLLYTMRLMGIGPLKGLAVAKVPDYDMNNVGANKTAEHQRVLNELQANYVSSQVPLENVQRNPFRMPEGMVVAPPASPDNPTPNKPAANPVDAAIQAELPTLKLQGVLGGKVPVARISGDAVRVGDQVGRNFTVAAIHGRSVDLTGANGKMYTLALDEADRNSSKHARP